MKNKGYMVLEALIAILIFGMLVVAIFPSVNFLVARTRRTKENSQASVYLQEGMEATYNILTQDPNPDLSGFTDGQYHLSQNSSTNTWELIGPKFPVDPEDFDGVFTRTIVIDSVCRDGAGEQKLCPGGEDVMSKKVTTTVTWIINGVSQPPIEASLVVVKL